jgi:hypothetical protein
MTTPTRVRFRVARMRIVRTILRSDGYPSSTYPYVRKWDDTSEDTLELALHSTVSAFPDEAALVIEIDGNVDLDKLVDMLSFRTFREVSISPRGEGLSYPSLIFSDKQPAVRFLFVYHTNEHTSSLDDLIPEYALLSVVVFEGVMIRVVNVTRHQAMLVQAKIQNHLVDTMIGAAIDGENNTPIFQEIPD